MGLTKTEMEAKLEALEDRIALLSQVVDRLEIRLDRKDDARTDWALILRAAAKVMEREAGWTSDSLEDYGDSRSQLPNSSAGTAPSTPGLVSTIRAAATSGS